MLYFRLIYGMYEGQRQFFQVLACHVKVIRGGEPSCSREFVLQRVSMNTRMVGNYGATCDKKCVTCGKGARPHPVGYFFGVRVSDVDG